MAITYGFFDSLDGDRVYNAATVSDMFKGLITNGVYQNVGDAFRVSAAGGLVLNVGTGRAMCGGRWVENDAVTTLTLNAAHVTLNRYTAVVLRRDLSARTVSLIMVDGSNASSPTRPAPTRTSTVYDLILAYVYVAAGATSVTATNIQDKRADTSVCGLVSTLIQSLDNAELFSQYEAVYAAQLAQMESWQDTKQDEFDAWFDDLTDDLNVDTYVQAKRATVCVASSEAVSVAVPVSVDFDQSANDVLQVFVNGLLLPASMYSVSFSESSFIVTRDVNFMAGDVVEFVCTKSSIGYNGNTGGGGGGGGLTSAVKAALLQEAQKVAYIDANGQDYYDDLYEALYSGPVPCTVTYTLSHVTSSNTTASIESGQSYTTTLTAASNYTLNTVSVTMGGVDITSSSYSSGTVSIASVTGNIVITATAVLAATSITATYTQSGTVYDTDSLDSLKSDLVVTANYSGGTSETVPSADYTLSGTLTEGTSTITVTYAGLTDTFTVTVTHAILPLYNWDFTQSLTDTVSSETAVLTGCTRDSSGVNFTANNQAIQLTSQKVSVADKTFIFDVSSYTGDDSGTNHHRLFCVDSANADTATGAAGFVYRHGFGWTVYSGSAWGSAFNSTTYPVDFFNNKRLKIYIDSNLQLTVSYASIGSDLFTEIATIATALTSDYASGYWIIGGTSNNVLQPCIFSAVKVYNGEV